MNNNLKFPNASRNKSHYPKELVNFKPFAGWREANQKIWPRIIQSFDENIVGLSVLTLQRNSDILTHFQVLIVRNTYPCTYLNQQIQDSYTNHCWNNKIMSILMVNARLSIMNQILVRFSLTIHFEPRNKLLNFYSKYVNHNFLKNLVFQKKKNLI